MDSFNGVNIDLTKLDASDKTAITSENIFGVALRRSLIEWKEAKYRAVWLKIPIEHSSLIKDAVLNGFVFHHAEINYAMMVNWLPGLELSDAKLDDIIKQSIAHINSSPIPENASHQVGIGCIIAHPNDKNKLLVVQEKRGPLRGKGVWKIPTGLVNAGEDLSVAAVREAMEETGIPCRFKNVITFRHSRGALHGKSDLFFICLLQTDQEKIVIQTSELEDVQWMDISK